MGPETTHALITNPVYIFLIVLSIILLAPMCLNRFKIPHIIGLIVAGIIVGPYGFHILDKDSSFEIFGQVGILYLMFLAGLEIDMFHLKKNLKNGLIFGIYTFFIPLVLGIITSVVFLGLDFVAATLLSSMYASHTLIAYPIVSRLGISKYNAVVIAITGTIIAVLASLVLLAATVDAHNAGEFQLISQLKLLLLLGIYLAVIIYAYPKLTKWFFRKYNDSVLQFVFIMVLVLLAATISIIIGIEPVLGAFFAGLILNRYIPSASSLMNRIEFVGNAIFIPYFLIGVGMLINIKLVFNDSATIITAIIMSIVAAATKWIAAYITQKHMKLKPVDRRIIFGLSNAHVAAALAAVMIGYRVGIFDEVILNATVLMILVSCTIASFVTEKAAADIKMQLMTEDTEETEEQKKAKSFRGRSRILIPISNPITISNLLSLAIIMRTQINKNPIFGLHVRNSSNSSELAKCKNALDIAEKKAASADVPFQGIDRFDLNLVTGIINTVNEKNISDIILGFHRKSNVVDSFFGNITEQLVNQLHKTIIISRCFIPLNTVTRIIVAVPPKAEFETGFRYWVIKLANMAGQIGCKIIFCASKNTQPYIKGVLHEQNYNIRDEYREIENWDDFLLLTNRIQDEDLFVLINARRTSISFNADMDNIPSFLSKYMTHNNLIVIYPEQFGETPQIISFSDPLIHEINTAPSGMYLKIRGWYRGALAAWYKLTRKNKKKKDIDL